MPSKPLRYLMLDLLCFAQGSIIVYFTSLCVIYLQGHCLNMVEFGFIGSIAIFPLILKIFSGKLPDRFFPNNIIITLVAAPMLPVIHGKNKIEQQGLAQ